MAVKERIHWIDIAKGFCILSVIAGHLDDKDVFSIVYPFHLTVFFLLSGYMLTRQEVNLAFCKDKFVKLMVPYFLTCLCIVLMDAANSVILNHNATVKTLTGIFSRDALYTYFASGFYKNFGTVKLGGRIGAIWFLPALYFALIFTQSILARIKAKENQLACALLLGVLGAVTGRFLWLPFSIQSAAFAVPFIWLGYEARQRDWLARIRPWHIGVCLACFLLVLRLDTTVLRFVTASALKNQILIAAAVGIMASAVVVWLCMKVKRCSLLEFYGRYSLQVLCIHLFELNTMRVWYNRLFAAAGVAETTWTLYAVKVGVITLALAALLGISYLLKRARHQQRTCAQEAARGEEARPAPVSPGLASMPAPEGAGTIGAGTLQAGAVRDLACDVAKGILIVLMLVGHYSNLDGKFRAGIYSFHMMAFVLLSGCFFKPERLLHLKTAVLRLAKSFLLPYAVFGAVFLLLNHNNFAAEMKQVAYGLSFTKNWFNDIKSIGPVYFILMLFLTRLIYLPVAKYFRGGYRHCVVFLLSLAGYFLGIYGYWLPWSLDCALYSLAFYHIGHLLRRSGAMRFLTGWYPAYFALSSLWIYMIYSGGMELVKRSYGGYGVTLMGATAATLLLVMLSDVLRREMPHGLTRFLSSCGKYTLYILIIHTLFRDDISSLAVAWSRKGHVAHLFLFVLLPLLGGIVLGRLLSYLGRRADSSLPH